MAHRVSTRISLRWLPNAPSEPTDTLIFNIGSYFMDLRVLKADAKIDWGMAGVREILSQSPCSYSPINPLFIYMPKANHGTVKCRWIKTIDSLGPSEPDEGEFTKLPNDDYLETGSMPYAENGGVVTEYEEVFRELELLLGAKRAWIIQSIDGKKFLGRVGGRYMALSGKEGTEFGARSEEWNEDEGWKTKYAIGELSGVPSFASIGSGQVTGEESWKVGEKVKVLGDEYIVRGFEDLA